MPELPDVTIYLEALERFTVGHRLERIRVASPFLVRSFDPPMSTCHGKTVREIRRSGKRLVLGLEDELFLVLHLMITGRLRWRPKDTKVPRRHGLAAFDFEHGCLLLTEMGSKKRASLHLVRAEAALAEHDRGGLELAEADLDAFRSALTRKNHTLKRALTDPRILSGIGNSYSDEILHRARLSPFKRTAGLPAEDWQKLFDATQEVVGEWTERLRNEVGDGFPEKVTAFRPGMAVHGRFGQPCPTCGQAVQRLVYAQNESNYCPTCQTGGKLLADRALSRLLKGDWPKTLEELEARKEAGRSQIQGDEGKVEDR